MIRITSEDTIMAMNKISSGKATSEDKIMDVIFKKSIYIEIPVDGDWMPMSDQTDKIEVQK